MDILGFSLGSNQEKLETLNECVTLGKLQNLFLLETVVLIVPFL